MLLFNPESSQRSVAVKTSVRAPNLSHRRNRLIGQQ